MDNINYFISLMPVYFKEIFDSFQPNIKALITEIRLRRNKPVIIYLKDRPAFIDLNRNLSSHLPALPLIICEKDFDFITDMLCNRSFHTNVNDMAQGFITTKNGSRVGIAGTAVNKNGLITSIKDINSLNIRISREVKGCAYNVVDLLYKSSIPSIIVAGKPLSGKTTFLRDLSRMLSSGFNDHYYKVSLIDERRELSSNFDVGINVDIICSYSKSQGIEIATRTLSPDIIICDEIGNIDEENAIEYGFSTGISFAVSVHMNSKQQIFTNKIIKSLINTNQFDYLIILEAFADKCEIIDLKGDEVENSRFNNDNRFYFFNKP